MSELRAITVRGPFHGPTGHDHHVREFVRELHRAGIAVQLLDLPMWHPARMPPPLIDPWFDSLSADTGADLTLHFCMPHQVVRDRGRCHVNYTMFEASRAPARWIRENRRHDLVILPTDSSRLAWIAGGMPESSLRLCPLGIDPALYAAPATPRPLPLSRGKRFLNVSEWSPRKNIEGLITAWLKATTPSDDAVLILKFSRYGPLRDFFPFVLKSVQEKARKSLAEAAPVHWIEELLSDAEMRSLYAAATHYISMSFGEGWDQPAFEAAASGLELIVPRHSAYPAYLDADSAHWIPSRAVPVNYLGDPATAALFEGAEWWQPDEDRAVEYIRAAIDGHGEARQSARERILTRFTWRQAAARLIEVLSEAPPARSRRWFSLRTR